MIMGGRQPDGQRAELTLSAQEGPIREWVDDLFAATNACWKPMTSRDGVSRTP